MVETMRGLAPSSQQSQKPNITHIREESKTRDEGRKSGSGSGKSWHKGTRADRAQKN